MAYQNIIFSLEDGIARVTLNRPDRLNSFNGEMHLELRDALAKTRDGGARVLLLTGAGRGFCAGQDLSDRNVSVGSDPVDLGYTIETYYKPLILSLRALEMPVICAVNGVAAGAGASIALACDIVLAARSASFIQAFCKLGLVPDAGGTWVLPRLVGTAKCFDDDKLMAEADKLAVHFSTAPTRGLARTKQAIYASSGNSLEQQLELERASQRELGFGHDYREGVAAFMEKRIPTFKGE
jgi:2-(1,2-epoxy-1,2-dihydrophenyl)acetyl-CoA isomerase